MNQTAGSNERTFVLMKAPTYLEATPLSKRDPEREPVRERGRFLKGESDVILKES